LGLKAEIDLIFALFPSIKSYKVILKTGYPLPASAGTGLAGMTSMVSI
jgi:hypothetical protein